MGGSVEDGNVGIIHRAQWWESHVNRIWPGRGKRRVDRATVIYSVPDSGGWEYDDQ